MRISDWSSDVCSSDLQRRQVVLHPRKGAKADMVDGARQQRPHQLHHPPRDVEVAERGGSEQGADQEVEQLLAGAAGDLAHRDVEAESAHLAEVPAAHPQPGAPVGRSAEHTAELQSLMRSSYAVFCLNNKKS